MKFKRLTMLLLVSSFLFVSGCAGRYSRNRGGGPGYSRNDPRMSDHRHRGGNRVHSHRDYYGNVFRHRH